MLQAAAVIFAVVATIVVAALWSLWELLALVVRATPVLCVWALAWTAETLFDIGYWIGERIAGWLERRDHG